MLLDTHTLIWALLTPEQLSETARTVLVSSQNLQISAVSIYEITLKASLGKWPDVEHLMNMDLTQYLTETGFDVVPVTGEVMQTAGSFEWLHRDPFDRVIVATAIHLNETLVSIDRTLDSCPDQGWTRVW